MLKQNDFIAKYSILKAKKTHIFPSIYPPIINILRPMLVNANLIEKLYQINENRIKQTNLFLENLLENRSQFSAICSFRSRIFKFWELKYFKNLI